ncbi:hypothetical protein D9619_006364 [Psilocybe cf. subviscida]|uniref:F-box domain-containing protein n=1 Tax=Psilocybe cf. subviscida TaxID=2480587 RepID=A0A8H5EYA4_9AGAR|nr:hypothetical protein D9619_006364 [Psilocybe cf. subviscida]
MGSSEALSLLRKIYKYAMVSNHLPYPDEHPLYNCPTMDLHMDNGHMNLLRDAPASIQSSSSFIDAIPTEILLLVFEEYCYSGDALKGLKPPQLVITHVCHYWRTVALSCTTLWSALDISPQTSLDMIAIYLQRSGDLPLSLQVDLRHDVSDPSTHEHVMSTWNTIKSTASRWRRLHIQVGPQDAISVSNNLRQVDSPVLEELRMTSVSHVPGLANMFEGGTPALKTLSLVGISLLQFAPPLQKLTRLHLTSNVSTSYETFWELLSKMTQLEELTLHSRVVSSWPIQPSLAKNITLPSLRTFKLSDQRCPLFVPLLSIAAPLLHTLCLSDLVVHDLPEASSESRIREYYPSVRNLVLNGVASFIDGVSFSQLTRIFPAVDHLSIVDVDPYFVRQSCEALHDPTIWPKLQTFTISPSLLDEDIFCSLLAARTTKSVKTALQTVIIPTRIHFTKLDWIIRNVNLVLAGEPISRS